ncbi:Uncharacterised protein [Paenibacillus macerans]|uniref:Uncharacterized protein n=1 Tax=Paenibacillus macerans TaxID=44252 RepID=A0A090ZF92_PAEMA|nr:hypothetical protein DJ90_480 [Paenibacillus macerans]SUD26963.1 Uncharacterised protein [Paenibacillus macerans]
MGLIGIMYYISYFRFKVLMATYRIRLGSVFLERLRCSKQNWVRRKSNGCNSGYLTKKALFKILTVVRSVICLNLSKMSRISVK